MNVHKSMASDGIHPRVLKKLSDIIAGPLSAIYQRSWESGEIPAYWKLASVILIYKKKGVREDPEDCRHVSLTSVPVQVMERVVLGDIERPTKKRVLSGIVNKGF